MTPIDLEASIEQNTTVYNDSEAFSIQLPDYFRIDAGIRIKRNYRRMTTTLSLDIQNLSNRQNLGGAFFNPHTLKEEKWYQTPLIPILAYRVDF